MPAAILFFRLAQHGAGTRAVSLLERIRPRVVKAVRCASLPVVEHLVWGVLFELLQVGAPFPPAELWASALQKEPCQVAAHSFCARKMVVLMALLVVLRLAVEQQARGTLVRSESAAGPHLLDEEVLLLLVLVAAAVALVALFSARQEEVPQIRVVLSDYAVVRAL